MANSVTAPELSLPKIIQRQSTDKKQPGKFLTDGLKAIYRGELNLIKILPEMISLSTTTDPVKAIDQHHKQTPEQVKRPEHIFHLPENKQATRVCTDMNGLIREGEEHMEETESGTPIRDPAIIKDAKIEHYEIAAYTSRIPTAKLIQRTGIVQPPELTLKDEMDSDILLTAIANHDIIPKKTNPQDIT